MKYRRDYSISYLRCSICDGVMPIPRKNISKREDGHLKDMWCPFCKDVTTFVERNQKWA